MNCQLREEGWFTIRNGAAQLRWTAPFISEDFIEKWCWERESNPHSREATSF